MTTRHATTESSCKRLPGCTPRSNASWPSLRTHRRTCVHPAETGRNCGKRSGASWQTEAGGSNPGYETHPRQITPGVFDGVDYTTKWLLDVCRKQRSIDDAHRTPATAEALLAAEKYAPAGRCSRRGVVCSVSPVCSVPLTLVHGVAGGPGRRRNATSPL